MTAGNIRFTLTLEATFFNHFYSSHAQEPFLFFILNFLLFHLLIFYRLTFLSFFHSHLPFTFIYFIYLFFLLGYFSFLLSVIYFVFLSFTPICLFIHLFNQFLLFFPTLLLIVFLQHLLLLSDFHSYFYHSFSFLFKFRPFYFCRISPSIFLLVLFNILDICFLSCLLFSFTFDYFLFLFLYHFS